MLDHEARLSETNGGDWIPLCECGWIGSVHGCLDGVRAKSKRNRTVVQLAQRGALNEHARHLHDERDAIARAHNDALDAHARYVGQVRPTLTRIGRWGNG